MKIKQHYWIGIACILACASCSRKGSAEQKKAFDRAVAHEQETYLRPSKQAAYMEVVAMDPTSEYGKAAAKRAEQLSK